MDGTGNKDDYKLFKSWVPKRSLALHDETIGCWNYYEFGPKDATPLVMIPQFSAEEYYSLFASLPAKGIRLISLNYPPYHSLSEFVKGFDRFLNQLKLNDIHLMGAGLGGYLAQLFLQFKPQRVKSLILINTFCDLSYFSNKYSLGELYNWMPKFLLEGLFLENFPTSKLDSKMRHSVDFMIDQIQCLSQTQLVALLLLNTSKSILKPKLLENFESSRVTIIESLDETWIPKSLLNEVQKYYPNAKVAQLKSGGNFPYISRSDQVNLHVQVHLRAAQNETAHENNS